MGKVLLMIETTDTWKKAGSPGLSCLQRLPEPRFS